MAFTILNKEFNGIVNKKKWMNKQYAVKSHNFTETEVQLLHLLGIVFRVYIVIDENDFIPEAYAIEEDN